MQRDVSHGQPVTGKQHREILGPGALGQNLGVPRVIQARRSQSLLVKRGGDDAVRLAGKSPVDCRGQEVVSGPTRGSAYFAYNNRTQILPRAIHARNRIGARLAFARMLN